MLPYIASSFPKLLGTITLTFFPESYNKHTRIAGPLSEFERATWSPSAPEDPEWRFTISGQFTSHVLDSLEADNGTYSDAPDERAAYEQTLNNIESYRKGAIQNHEDWGAFFEVARLALHLPSYLDFMYDLVVTDRKFAGTQVKGARGGSSGRGKQINIERAVYKIVRSVRIIRPEQGATEEPTFRNWTAPSYSFHVRGHWRKLQDESRKGRDPEGREVLGKTWVHSYQKYEDRGDDVATGSQVRDPGVVIKVKQTLQFARDYIAAHEADSSPAEAEFPSTEWMADERAKLSAGLRYLILKRDGFRCRKCGKSQADDNFVRLEVDHIKPVSQWGRTIENNLETLCRDCNSGKSNKS